MACFAFFWIFAKDDSEQMKAQAWSEGGEENELLPPYKNYFTLTKFLRTITIAL